MAQSTDERIIKYSWLICLVLVACSGLLWSIGVKQLGTWAAFVPAFGLVSGLFTVVSIASLRRPGTTWQQSKVVVTTLTSIIWCLAMAIGL